jgi:hypothetical protein
MKIRVILFMTLFTLQTSFAGNGAAESLAGQITDSNGGNSNPGAGTNQAVYQSATNAKNQNQSGQIISTMISTGMQLVGAMQMMKGCPPTPRLPSCYTGVALIVGSQVFTMQAKNNAASGAVARNTMGQSTAWDTSGGGDVAAYQPTAFDQKALAGNLTDDDLLNDPYIRKSMDVEAYKAAIADLEEKSGINLKDPNATLKIDGKDVKVSSLKDADSLKNAGLSSAANAFDSALASIKADAERRTAKVLGAGAPKTAAGFDEGGGARSNAGTASTADTATPIAEPLAKDSSPRDPASLVSGLTKDFNGDPIGVSSDFIFGMMTRRYKLKEKQNSFIERNLGAEPSLQK